MRVVRSFAGWTPGEEKPEVLAETAEKIKECTVNGNQKRVEGDYMPQDKDELLQVLITQYAQMYMKLAYAIRCRLTM